MKSVHLLLFIFYFCISCSNKNTFQVSNITDGNTIILTNGIAVDLLGVEDDNSNIKIIDHYIQSPVLLYDENNDDITSFSSTKISAVVYNSDGDCINNLLIGIKNPPPTPPIIVEDSNNFQSVIKFNFQGEVMIVPVMVNGARSYFIFDTGASYTTISKNKADSLRRDGTLSNFDMIEKKQFTVATGGIAEGTLIRLKSVIIGNRELQNVQACVIEGQNAPLLLGQSVLRQFGNYYIDNVRNEITFR